MVCINVFTYTEFGKRHIGAGISIKKFLQLLIFQCDKDQVRQITIIIPSLGVFLPNIERIRKFKKYWTGNILQWGTSVISRF